MSHLLRRAVQQRATLARTPAPKAADAIVPGGQEFVRSYDNRRLRVAKQAQVGDPRVRWSSPAEQRTNGFKFTGNGRNITVRA